MRRSDLRESDSCEVDCTWHQIYTRLTYSNIRENTQCWEPDVPREELAAAVAGRLESCADVNISRTSGRSPGCDRWVRILWWWLNFVVKRPDLPAQARRIQEPFFKWIPWWRFNASWFFNRKKNNWSTRIYWSRPYTGCLVSLTYNSWNATNFKFKMEISIDQWLLPLSRVGRCGQEESTGKNQLWLIIFPTILSISVSTY